MEHPPYLPPSGHYLCTVAACGHKDLVKPFRIGIRHGQKIIINRQLLIANAFEQVLEQYIPSIHNIIRRGYDKYGFPLCKYINSPVKSDLVYLTMKPLEWFFLSVLYLVDKYPENRIARQYTSMAYNY